jgi:hypothetical protein
MGRPVVHFEIIGTDGTALRAFYAELFGWAVQFVPEMNYGLVDTQAGSGINGGIGTSGEGGPRVIFYIEVPDPQEALDAVEANGGTTVAPVDVVPGVVTFAQFADPQSNVVGLVKAAEAAQDEGGTPSAGAGAAVSYFEVFGPGLDGQLSFYEDLFGWAPLHQETGGVPYVQVDPGGGRGMVGAIGDNGQGTSRVILYASVPELQPYCDKAPSSAAALRSHPARSATRSSSRT